MDFLQFAFVCLKLIQVCLAGKQKFEKRFALEAASLPNTKQYQVVFHDSFMETCGYGTLFRNMPDGSFCHIIMPRYTILVKKCKKTAFVSSKEFLIFLSYIRFVWLIINDSFEKLRNFLVKLM